MNEQDVSQRRALRLSVAVALLGALGTIAASVTGLIASREVSAKNAQIADLQAGLNTIRNSIVEQEYPNQTNSQVAAESDTRRAKEEAKLAVAYAIQYCAVGEASKAWEILDTVSTSHAIEVGEALGFTPQSERSGKLETSIDCITLTQKRILLNRYIGSSLTANPSGFQKKHQSTR